MTVLQPTIVCRMFGKGAFASMAVCLLLGSLAACGPAYSPDTYSSNAVQQANKVDQGVIVGVRAIAISADSTLATATGGGVGGIAGSQVGGGTVGALGALGGSVAGGVVGNVVGHTTGDTSGYEYIVRKPSGDLLSVTQKDPAPLKIGQHVLIIEGPQARIVPDYTVAIDDDAHQSSAGAPKPAEAKSEPGPTAPATDPHSQSSVAAAATAGQEAHATEVPAAPVATAGASPVTIPPDKGDKPAEGGQTAPQDHPTAAPNAAPAPAPTNAN